MKKKSKRETTAPRTIFVTNEPAVDGAEQDILAMEEHGNEYNLINIHNNIVIVIMYKL